MAGGSKQSEIDKLVNICNKLGIAIGKITIFSIIFLLLALDPTAPHCTARVGYAGRIIVALLCVPALYFFLKAYYMHKKENNNP